MEVHLDRALVDRRIFPSINIERSGTRKEELLYHPDEYNKVVILRRALTGVPPVEAMELVLNKLKKTGSNIEFLLSMSVVNRVRHFSLLEIRGPYGVSQFLRAGRERVLAVTLAASLPFIRLVLSPESPPGS